ncbi:MAG: response regulator [Deltaproteobacteria bacterium]|nr:response regulator [Deltaproteobacteria bacterium]
MNTAQPFILYVDDEAANRLVFEHSFSERFRVKTVGSGQEAIEILARERVAVLVTDQRMPDMSGNELLNHAKSRFPEVIRIVITAYSDLDPILRAVNEGLVARYIIKPWDYKELADILAWAVEAYTFGHSNHALQLRLLETERLTTLGSIAAAVMHDLNQPLSYMLTNADRLVQLSRCMSALSGHLDQHAHVLSPNDRNNFADLVTELPGIAGDVDAGVRVMRELTTTIRNLIRPAKTSEEPSVDPTPVVQYSLSVCRGPALASHAMLQYDGPARLPKIRIGFTGLAQVLINLVRNAANALAEGGKSGGRVTVTAAEAGDAVRFSVIDDGPGMSEETLRKVGTPFFSTGAEGTGLGVAQCRRLVAQHGGELEIRSTLGRGTSVSFTVPKA